ncbi:MAG: 50S ribosomal protein L9 [Thermoguttaceae bacterium]|nr:50S ribosomal protein L9 [Thermoguttaceae bacterium]MDW8038134.1 50S ribosomal protein L9 [Thermoguttaceae bacterium]
MAKSKTSEIHSPYREKRLSHRRGYVELLLVQPVEHLGDQGDVVRVKPGYAYNYLIPQGLATIATEHHKRMIEKHKARLAEIQRRRLASLRSLAAQLAKQSVTIEANANEEGHLYGSVGAHEIAMALKELGFSITEEQVRLKGPLKELGLYTVQIHLGQEIDADLKVWVVPSVKEEKPEKPQKPEKAAKTEKAEKSEKAQKPSKGEAPKSSSTPNQEPKSTKKSASS